MESRGCCLGDKNGWDPHRRVHRIFKELWSRCLGGRGLVNSNGYEESWRLLWHYDYERKRVV